MTMRAMVCSSESLVAVVRGTFRGFASALGKSPELRRGKTERSSVLVVRYLISVPESPWFRALRLHRVWIGPWPNLTGTHNVYYGK
jgi:hypothetical protein